MTKPAARLGDMHVCPKVEPGPIPHVGGPLVQGSPNVNIGGMPAARIGDMATCVGPSDKVSVGSSTVFINGKSAARLGDTCQHGGRIVAGCPTVFIGEGSGSGSPVAQTSDFAGHFQKMTGMSVEDSISLYKSQAGEILTADQVQKMFTDAKYAKAMLLANENLHKIYRNDILNSNVPQTIADARTRGFIQLPVYKSVFHNPWYDPWRNSKWVGPDGHMEVVFNGNGELVSDIRYLGTFNFFGPDQASEHWAADVTPYEKWGN